MKVFVAGGTGVAGRRAVRALVGAGHDVTAIARSDSKESFVRELGASPVRVDVFDAAALRRAVDGHDVVINLATHIPAPSKTAFRRAWRENDRLRSEASRNLVDVAIAARAQRYVQESVAFFYRDRGDEWIAEDTPYELPAYAGSIADAEGNARRFREHGVGVVLRFGMFYAAETPHTKAQIGAARRGMSPFFGRPDAYVSLIHADDTGTAVLAALDVPSGEWNVAEDEPLTRQEVSDVLARALGKTRLRFPPRWLLGLGGDTVKALARSVRVSNRRFKDASSWSPRYASAREGLPAVVDELTRSKQSVLAD